MSSNKPPKRVAIYCRVSSDEKLDMSFNSLDAQRLAGESYIASQNAEGWVLVPNHYDDGGYSGGNIERPALKNLLATIQNHEIDIVLVYKIDRLSRSIADFAKLIKLFDANSVTFASMTQPINSGDSMGRLMLNVLLSFAQFELEVTTERIRDKIAASKKLGIWMGGYPPLGYDVRDRKLIINEPEAAIVQRIFSDFVIIQSSTEISRQLNDEGITTKPRTRNGKLCIGNRFDKQHLGKLLRNQIYIGKIGHKGTWYDGQHEPIIGQALWGQVQEILDTDSRQRGIETQELNRTDVLLRGILFTPSGEKMHPTFTNKSGKRYYYYISRSEQRFGAAAKTFDRLPCDVVDEAVLAQVKSVLSSPESVQAVWNQLQADSAKIDKAAATASLGRLSEVWDCLFPAEKHRIVRLMIERVDLVPSGISVSWRKLGWQELIGEFKSVGKKSLRLEAA